MTNLLESGAVEIIERTPDHLHAEVAGRTGHRRTVTHDSHTWHCTCPAWAHRRRCAHVDAVALITAPPGYRRLPPQEQP